MNPSCTNCGGSGWVIAERNGRSGASRCPCSAPSGTRAASNRPTLDDMTQVVVGIAELETIPFFPKNPKALAVIAASMLNYIFDYATLKAFAAAYVEYAKKYEGPAGMREIYARYVDAPATQKAEDLEQRYLMREIEDNEQRMATWKNQRLLAAPGAQEPMALPRAKTFDDVAASTPPQAASFGSSRSFKEIQDALMDASVRPPVLSLKEREERLEQSVRVTRVRSHSERLRVVQEVRSKLQAVPL